MLSRCNRPDLWFMVLLFMSAAGCGNGRYPVHGKVTREDGTPIGESMIVFESVDRTPNITARGDIDLDGSYELGTTKPGDGAPVGKYRVKITPLMANVDEPTHAPPFDPRFSDFKTSGLEFEIKPGSNDFSIKVKQAPAKVRR
jgi:hypothetical protein